MWTLIQIPIRSEISIPIQIPIKIRIPIPIQIKIPIQILILNSQTHQTHQTNQSQKSLILQSAIPLIQARRNARSDWIRRPLPLGRLAACSGFYRRCLPQNCQKLPNSSFRPLRASRRAAHLFSKIASKNASFFYLISGSLFSSFCLPKASQNGAKNLKKSSQNAFLFWIRFLIDCHAFFDGLKPRKHAFYWSKT